MNPSGTMMIPSILVLLVLSAAMSASTSVFAFTPTLLLSSPLSTRTVSSTTGSTPLYTTTTSSSSSSNDSNGDTTNHDDDGALLLSSRRTMIQQTLVALPSAVLLTQQQPLPANAAVTGANKVNAKLATFGLPKIADIPDGYVPILEIYGKGKNRNPLLVTFSHPVSWVVTLPSNNLNGEDGTIQVGDYGKGDTASLFVDDSVSSSEITKATIEEGLRKCISQRGSNMYQSFKLLKVTDGPTVEGQSYQIAEFKYQLLTGAGFEVDRRGIAAITMSNKKQMEIFWAASIDARYKKTADTLRNIVTSFRCYASGLNFSDEIIA